MLLTFLYIFDIVTQFVGLYLNFEQKHIHKNVIHTIMYINKNRNNLNVNSERVVNKLWHII